MKMPAVVEDAEVRQYDISGSEDFSHGAAVLLDGSQEVTEAGADPASILGFALGDAAVVPFEGKCLVALAQGPGKFWMSGDSDPTSSDIDTEYGVAEDSDGVWYVDTTDTSATRVYVIDVDTDKNMYLVKVLEANRQIAA